MRHISDAHNLYQLNIIKSKKYTTKGYIELQSLRKLNTTGTCKKMVSLLVATEA